MSWKIFLQYDFSMGERETIEDGAEAWSEFIPRSGPRLVPTAGNSGMHLHDTNKLAWSMVWEVGRGLIESDGRFFVPLQVHHSLGGVGARSWASSARLFRCSPERLTRGLTFLLFQ